MGGGEEDGGRRADMACRIGREWKSTEELGTRKGSQREGMYTHRWCRSAKGPWELIDNETIALCFLLLCLLSSSIWLPSMITLTPG